MDFLELFASYTRLLQVKTLLRQKSRPVEVSGRPKTCKKWFRVQSLQHFADNTRSFQVKTLTSKDSITLEEQKNSCETIKTKRLTSRSKSLAHSKIAKKIKI